MLGIEEHDKLRNQRIMSIASGATKRALVSSLIPLPSPVQAVAEKVGKTVLGKVGPKLPKVLPMPPDPIRQIVGSSLRGR